jgi:hypothetical protein
MGLSIIVLDVAIAVLGLQCLGAVTDPGTYGFIVTVVVVLVVLHLVRILL